MTVATFGWPEHCDWTLIVQSVLEGRTQEIHFSLMSEHSLAFEAVKTAFLRLYELVPEANLQKFPNLMKPEDQTNAEFVAFYSHMDICAPITTGSDSSYKFSRYRLISAATYWEVTCPVAQTKVIGLIPRKGIDQMYYMLYHFR